VGRHSRPGTRAGDPADAVAAVALAKRSLLLHVNRHRLRREDLEDCYSQTMLELVAHVRAGGVFANDRHLGASLELRFASRIRDRRRALAGRSPMQAALESALTLAGSDEGVALVDRRADVERLVIAREEVRTVGGAAGALTADQRLALSSQLSSRDGSAAEFCARHGWTAEKYRKVAQRGRARLRQLMRADGEAGVGRAGP
jgi:DNA-directed RNA polymerase specialized sigma24 family protein